MKFLRKINDSGGPGAGAQRELAENELKLSLSMGRKIIEILEENDGFWWSWGARHQAISQKMSLSCPSVWGGKSLKFFRKMKDSRGLEVAIHCAFQQNLSLESHSVW